MGDGRLRNFSLIGYSPPMPQDMLRSAIDRARTSDPTIKAAALLHCARVMTAFDREEAIRLLDEGLALTMTFPQHSSEREEILTAGCLCAAAVDPERAMHLYNSGLSSRHIELSNLIWVMLNHCHITNAIQLLSGNQKSGEYPFVAVGVVMTRCSNDDDRRGILRTAIDAWKSRASTSPLDRSSSHWFLSVFADHWKILPEEEATNATREIVASILEHPDCETMADVTDIRFTSHHAFQLFMILPLIRRLTPSHLDFLMQTNPQLTAGAARYPMGMESIQEERKHKTTTTGSGGGGGFVISGNSNDFPAIISRMEAQREGNFEPHFQNALRLYADDVESNRATRECWPSTHEFRNALYHAGKIHGREASAYLDRIPDADLRLLAEIEFIAALAGLPQISGIQRSRPRQPWRSPRN